MRTVMNLITVLSLCSICWICVSGSEFNTIKVQAGEDVTLQCTNISQYDPVTWWFRLVNRTTVSCISDMFSSTSMIKYSDGFQNGLFEMSTDISTVFLKIKQVKLSDSGLYFCGFYSAGHALFSVTRLDVEESDGVAKLMCFILGGVSVSFITVIIGLIIQNRKLQTANKEENRDQREDSWH